jgi:phage major head subunit gpT-like protein
LFAIKPEGAATGYDSARQGFIARYRHDTYTLGFIITKEMIEDDQYGIIGQKRASALAESMRETKEVVHANVLNRGFNSSYVGADGKELFSTSHPMFSGGTFSNTLAVAADLSEAALEQASIDISSFTDDRGNKKKFMAKRLIVPKELVFEAQRILKTDGRVGTANNDLNALKTLGIIPEMSVNHYLTDADAWFIKTNATDGLKTFERVADSFDDTTDFDTTNLKYMGRMRFVAGWTDPRGAYASPGA